MAFQRGRVLSINHNVCLCVFIHPCFLILHSVLKSLISLGGLLICFVLFHWCNNWFACIIVSPSLPQLSSLAVCCCQNMRQINDSEEGIHLEYLLSFMGNIIQEVFLSFTYYTWWKVSWRSCLTHWTQKVCFYISSRIQYKNKFLNPNILYN